MTAETEREAVVRSYAGMIRFGGIKIIESDVLTVGPFEDWAGVRSQGRARRRRRLGHRQNIRFYWMPDPKFVRVGDTIIGHPQTVAALRLHLALPASRVRGSDG